MFQEKAGVCNVPQKNVMSWHLALRNGIVITIWTDSRVKIARTTALDTDIENMEVILSEHFGAHWVESHAVRNDEGKLVIWHHGGAGKGSGGNTDFSVRAVFSKALEHLWAVDPLGAASL